MSFTVQDINNLLLKSNKFGSNFSINGNQISVYLDLNKDARRLKLEEIRDYIKSYSTGNDENNSPITPYKTITAYNRNGPGSTIGRVEIFRENRQNTIVVYAKPISKPTIEKTWKKNEEAIPKAFYDYKTKNDLTSLDIVITDGIKTVTISNVISIVDVGAAGKKTDVRITTNNGKQYNLSLKMTTFRSWESQSNGKQEIRSSAEKIIKKLPNPTAAFQKNSISSKATLDEVKTVCYGVTNEIDYILSANFSQSSFNFSNNTLKITVNKIYDKSITSLQEVQNNCYMLIEKVSNPSIMITPQFKGYKISFVPKNIADSSLPGKR